MILPHRALYASFDRVPSPKGAATHIERFAGGLFEAFGGGLIHVLGDDSVLPNEREGRTEILRYSRRHDHFLDRVEGFGGQLSAALDRHADTLEMCHFRDPWSGVPILHRKRRYRTVYEVNGLPSIELPSAYAELSPNTLAKIREAERFCWTQADAIVTPSRSIASNLVALGAEAEKIQVIPNGADLPHATPARPAAAPVQYLIYFGALQSWQGLDCLLRAMQGLADLAELKLVVCASSHPRLVRPYVRLAERLGVADRIVWLHALSRTELAGWVAHAAASIAPLTECARNLQQGCAPLKVLESMALGVPIIASAIPSVREVVEHNTHARLVPANRPAELARAIRIVLEYPAEARAMALRAQEKLAAELTWAHSVDKLKCLYRTLLNASGPSHESS